MRIPMKYTWKMTLREDGEGGMMRYSLFVFISMIFVLTSCTLLKVPDENLELLKPLNSEVLLPVRLVWKGTPPFDVFVDGSLIAENIQSTEITLDDLDLGRHTWQVRSEKGWSEMGVFTVVEAESTLVIYVTSSTSGPAVGGAVVTIEESTGLTDESGVATVTFTTKRKYVDIEVYKEGYAWSGVEGLKIAPWGTREYRVLLRKPFLSLKNEENPFELEAQFMDSEGKPLDDLTVDATFSVLATATSKFDIHYFYGALGKIPGANYMTGPRVLIEDSPVFSATFTTTGYSGETEFHLVVYDYNENRLDKIFYIDVNPQNVEVHSPYKPEKKSLRAFTISEEIIFYSADENSNTWVELKWVPWEESDSSPTTQKPQGYVIYRSMEGEYEKAGFVPANFGVFRDHSPKLKPGLRVSYTVCSLYTESNMYCEDFGSVTPLKPFRVNLIEPGDMEIGVLRNPTFVLKGNELSSDEGSVKYVYSLFILDEIFSDSYLIEATPVNGKLNLVLHESDFPEFEASFSELPWYYYDPITGDYKPYKDSKLEANKTYEWGLIQAHAYVKDEDSISLSLFIDRIYVGLPWRWTNRFTTGAE